VNPDKRTDFSATFLQIARNLLTNSDARRSYNVAVQNDDVGLVEVPWAQLPGALALLQVGNLQKNDEVLNSLGCALLVLTMLLQSRLERWNW
jgi:hypothetical protein